MSQDKKSAILEGLTNEDWTGGETGPVVGFYAGEKTPEENPYGGQKSRKFRGAISETPNETPVGDQPGGWRTYSPKPAGLDESEEELEEDLHKWFKEKWVRFGPDGKIKGPCARGSSKEGKPKCLPQSKAHNLGKKGRASAAARKRREDPNPNRSGKAINVNTKKKKTNEGVMDVTEGENWSKHNNKRVGGMSKKSVSVYRREHPGSKIQTAVTTKPNKLKKGSKAAKRRKSFCARMRGMKKHRTSAKTARDPNSNINKSLRRWHCESVEELNELLMLAEAWSEKYKRSINCKHPKGFSQRAHCAGKKKHNESVEMEMTCPDCGMCETHANKKPNELDENCWKGYHKEGNKKLFGKTVPNCVKNEGVAEGSENFNGIDIDMDLEGDEIMVRAMANGRELGHVIFVEDGEYLLPQDLEVDERYQGQGIAATMYDYVKSKGYKIRRSCRQTDAGAGFWAKHRPKQNVWEQGVAEALTYPQKHSSWSVQSPKKNEFNTPYKLHQGEEAKAHAERIGGKLVKVDQRGHAIRASEGVAEEKCPHCGGELVSEDMINEKKDACYYKVKRRYKVWPSAYASGALVKCRKAGASNWGNKSESVMDEAVDPNQIAKVKAAQQKALQTAKAVKNYEGDLINVLGQVDQIAKSAGVDLDYHLTDAKQSVYDLENAFFKAATEPFEDMVDYIESEKMNTHEAANPAQQAAIAIAMKKAGKKPKNEDTSYAGGGQGGAAGQSYRLFKAKPAGLKEMDSFDNAVNYKAVPAGYKESAIMKGIQTEKFDPNVPYYTLMIDGKPKITMKNLDAMQELVKDYKKANPKADVKIKSSVEVEEARTIGLYNPQTQKKEYRVVYANNKPVMYFGINDITELKSLLDYMQEKNPNVKIEVKKEIVTEDKESAINTDKLTDTIVDFYKNTLNGTSAKPVKDFDSKAQELIGQATDARIKKKVISVLNKARENPMIQGGVITAVRAILAGKILGFASGHDLSPRETNVLLQGVLNTVIPTMVSIVNNKDWKSAIKYVLASFLVGVGMASLEETNSTGMGGGSAGIGGGGMPGGTYEEEYGPFKSKGPRRITAMTY